MSFGAERAAECARQMGCYIVVAALFFIAGVIGIGVVGYRYGYDQGRNDGFHAGWREANAVSASNPGVTKCDGH